LVLQKFVAMLKLVNMKTASLGECPRALAIVVFTLKIIEITGK
jgi:hypothetical protein